MHKRKNKIKLQLCAEDRSMLLKMLTAHAEKRMSQRGVSLLDVLCALDYGSSYASGSCWRMVVGKNEQARAPYDISAHVGVHIVISSERILTVYKNKHNQKRRRLRKKN